MKITQLKILAQSSLTVASTKLTSACLSLAQLSPSLYMFRLLILCLMSCRTYWKFRRRVVQANKLSACLVVHLNFLLKYGHGHGGLEIRNACCKIIYDFEILGHFICAKMIYMLYNIWTAALVTNPRPIKNLIFFYWIEFCTFKLSVSKCPNLNKGGRVLYSGHQGSFYTFP